MTYLISCYIEKILIKLHFTFRTLKKIKQIHKAFKSIYFKQINIHPRLLFYYF